MKITLKRIAALAGALVMVGSLTACDPPMPPDVAAQMLEQTYTCKKGDVAVAFPALMQDVGFNLNDSLIASCVDPLPEMTLTTVTVSDEAQIFVSDYPVSPSICKPVFTVPYAIEAAALAFMNEDSSSLTLSPKTAAAILNGKITSWDDPAIATENPDTTFTAKPIVVRASADSLAFLSLNSWLTRFKSPIDAKSFKITKSADAADQNPLDEGEIAIVPNSFAFSETLSVASILMGIDKETGDQLLAVPDNQGIPSAATQWVAKSTKSKITVELDPSLPALPLPGLDVAATPYQAIYPVNLSVCGKESLLNRAVALYMLRLDSQGWIPNGNFNQLSEEIRLLSLDMARQGLPIPKLTEGQ